MKNTADMTREEMMIEIVRLYRQLTPENRVKARAFAHKLYLEEQEGKAETNG